MSVKYNSSLAQFELAKALNLDTHCAKQPIFSYQLIKTAMYYDPQIAEDKEAIDLVIKHTETLTYEEKQIADSMMQDHIKKYPLNCAMKKKDVSLY